MASRISGLAGLLPCLAVGLMIAFLQPSMASEPRVALVIGNSNYGPEIGLLKNPGSDAKLIADTLKGLGFQVDLVFDADQKAMKRAVKSFGARLREAGSEATGLFYYAGHGVQVEGINYLLPVGAEISAEADVEIESITADDVMTQMQSAGNAVNLVFLDACRNNPLARATRSVTRGLARLDAPRGSFVGYSTAPGDVAADGDGANSLYALALAEELKTPGISIEEAHRNVRAKVLAASGGKQTPWDSSSLTGPVILAEATAPAPAAAVPAPAPAPAPAPVVTQQASVDKEALFWESIKGSTDVAEFEAYLAQYPQGTFAGLAKAKIAKLATPKVAQQPAALAAPAVQNQDQATLRIIAAPDIKDKYEMFLRNCETRKVEPCFIAIARDGSAVAVMRAKIDLPTGKDYARATSLKDCGGAASCVLVMEDGKLKPGLEVTTADQATAQLASAPEPESGQGSATARTIAVSAEIQGEIDAYLRNVSSGKFSALAIVADGSEVAVLACPRVNPGSMGTRCKASGSGYLGQKEVSARALKACGGDKCLLLYEGDRKVADLDLVTQ